MKIRLSLIVVSIFLLTCTTAFAQTSSEIDSHIAAAKAAAAQNFRDTFVNLCLPGAAPGGAARGGPPRGAGAAAATPATPDRAGWYASPYKVFGFDRGLPVDRYYIERFLSDHRDDIIRDCRAYLMYKKLTRANQLFAD